MMDKLPNMFIKAGLVYLVVSTILGVLITLGPGFSFMHSHLALIGWVSFLLFGLAYQIIPQYSRKPIFSEKFGILQFWLANIGLIGLSLSYPFMRMYMLKGLDYSLALTIVVISGVLEALSIFIFVFNIWKSMKK